MEITGKVLGSLQLFCGVSHAAIGVMNHRAGNFKGAYQGILFGTVFTNWGLYLLLWGL